MNETYSAPMLVPNPNNPSELVATKVERKK
jgi:hypothetical protein